MTRMPKRSYYTILGLAAVAAILLVFPVTAFEPASVLPSDQTDMAQAPTLQIEAQTQSSIQYFEKVSVTPNEEMAGVVIKRFEDRIWEDDIVVRPDDI